MTRKKLGDTALDASSAKLVVVVIFKSAYAYSNISNSQNDDEIKFEI